MSTVCLLLFIRFFLSLFKVVLVLGKPKLLIMKRRELPIKELFLKVHQLRNYPRVLDKPIENLKKERKRVEKIVFKIFFRNKNIYYIILAELLASGQHSARPSGFLAAVQWKPQDLWSHRNCARLESKIDNILYNVHIHSLQTNCNLLIQNIYIVLHNKDF